MNDELDPSAIASLDDGPYSHLKSFLLGKGIARHKQTAEIAALLGLAKTSVFRKFKGESTFTQPELKTIADHFGTDIDRLRGQARAQAAPPRSERSASGGEPALLHIGGQTCGAQLLPGPALAEEEVCDLVAFLQQGRWQVAHRSAPEAQGQQLHSIERLELTSRPRRRVAVLEDDSNAAALIGMALEREGMQVRTYLDPSSFIQALSERPCPAYVIDWLLGGSTAEAAIRAIRERQPQATIVITTGAMHTGAETEGALIPFAERHGASIFEKPFRPAVLASFLRRGLAQSGAGS